MTQSAAVFVDAGGNFSLGETFFFPQFDRDIGELLKVTFTATILVSNEVDLANVSDDPNNWFPMAFRATGQAVVVTPLGVLINEFGEQIEVKGTVGPGAVLESIIRVGGTEMHMSDTPATRLAFTGTGFAPVSVSGIGTYAFSTGDPSNTMVFSFREGFSARVTAEYEYAPNPEPSTMALLGLVGLGVAWRRRRKRQA